MRLCVVGPDKRTETNLRLLNAAKRVFDSVLYVPYSSVCLSVKDEIKVSFKNINLSRFDAIIPRIPKNRSLFGYLLLHTLGISSPIEPEAYVITSDRFLMLNMLRRKGIAVPNVYFIDSVQSAISLIDDEEIKFPFSMRMPETEKGIMIAKVKKEAKSMLGTLKTFDKPVYIEELSSGPYIDAYVIGNKAVASVRKSPENDGDIFHGKGRDKSIKISHDIENIALAAASSAGTRFALVRILEKKRIVMDVILYPELRSVIEKTKVPIDEMLVNHVAGSVTPMGDTWIGRFFGEAKTKVKGIFE